MWLQAANVVMNRYTFSGPMEAKRYFISTGLIGLTALMSPMPAGAGQGSAHFQVSLRIVARPPAPKLSQQVVSAEWPGDPPYPVFKAQPMAQEKSGAKFIILTTKF